MTPLCPSTTDWAMTITWRKNFKKYQQEYNWCKHWSFVEVEFKELRWPCCTRKWQNIEENPIGNWRQIICDKILRKIKLAIEDKSFSVGQWVTGGKCHQKCQPVQMMLVFYFGDDLERECFDDNNALLSITLHGRSSHLPTEFSAQQRNVP